MPDDSERTRALAISAPHKTTADKIRALDGAGFARADIARFLGKRYQHVRNVLEGDAQSSGGYMLGKADLSGVRSVREDTRAFEHDPDPAEIDRRSSGVFWLRIRADGSLPLPPELADALGAAPGSRVQAQLRDGAVNVVSAEAAAERARAMIRAKVKTGSVVDEFLAERRASWGEEDA